MHACGHDTHVAMLASAARVLAGRRDQLAGRVAFFFQPGEEGFHGAREALEEGLLGTAGSDADGNPVAGAFALHISATFRSGEINVRPGPLLASADHFVAPHPGPRRARLRTARRAGPDPHRGRGRAGVAERW